MSKNAHILVVETENPEFEGYVDMDPIEYISRGNLWFGYRPHLETLDPQAEGHPHASSFLQLIPYVILKHEGRVGTYIRPDKGNEGRLHGKASIGVGGHIDLEDVVHEDSVVDLDQTLRLSCIREIREEVDLSVGLEKHLTRIRHGYTHFKIVADVFICRYLSGRVHRKESTAHRWVRIRDLNRYPFPKANRKFIPILKDIAL